MPTIRQRRLARRPQIEECFGLVPNVVARQVVNEASRWLGVTLHGRFAARLAFRAQRCYAHSKSFRGKIRRPGDGGRDRLYAFMRHWLAARLHAEEPALYARLPKDYACGAPLPPPATETWLAQRELARMKATGAHLPPVKFPSVNSRELSLEARLLAFG